MSERDPGRRNLYGRRRGHRLRAGQKAALDQVLPELAVDPADPVLQHSPRALFDPAVRAVWLEIGFGAGEHLAWQAAAHPDIGYLGAEPYVSGVARLLRELDRRRLRNVRLYPGDGHDLLDVLPPQSLSGAFILFPDPWPKTRHRRRRLVSRETLDRLADLMADDAELRLATDHAGYQAWILQRLLDDTRFEWLARRPDDWRTRPDDWPPTRYEDKARAEGRQPVFLRARRRAREG
jgi:tRNA (guanine-N7-)-methyltransferase